MENKKKGQVALELLTTYGLAFVIILVVFGAFAYFGVLNPYNLIPDYCTTGAEISCQDISVQTDKIQIELKNNLGKPIVISEIAFPLEVQGTGQVGHCNFYGSETLSPQEMKVITTTENCLLLNKGEKVKLNPSIKYSISGGSFVRETSGTAVTSQNE